MGVLISERPRRGLHPAAGGWWKFVAPLAVAVALLYFLPLVINVFLSFTDWSGYHSDINFSGWDNLKTLWTQYHVLDQVGLTLVYALTASLIGNFGALALALALERRTAVNMFLRAVFFLPVLISPLASGYIWAAILDPAGPLNHAISMAQPGFAEAWLANPGLAIFLCAAIDAWKWMGFFTLVFIAGLTTVPEDLKEVAKMMGCNAWQVFRHAKLPFLAPAFTYNITVTVIGAMSTFDIILATTRGGPGNATRVLNVLTLDQFGIGYFGLASTTQLVVTILVTAAAIPLVRFLRGRELEG
jgi:multiple sugar transport system permease protein/raffinose/stachyose/melibiose transport system permease protein